jgi:hypothetical protein
MGQLASAINPVVAVGIAISVVRAAGVPFPAALESSAWAHWVVFGVNRASEERGAKQQPRVFLGSYARRQCARRTER